jgi:hypothetical protein
MNKIRRLLRSTSVLLRLLRAKAVHAYRACDQVHSLSARNHLAAYRNEKSAFLKTGTEFLIAGDLQTALRAG